MEQQDNLFNTFDKTLYRQGSPLYKGDGNPITDISNIQPSNVGDGYPTGNTEMVKGAFQSGNFLTGVRGWQLTPDSAEFQTAIFNIGGTTITIDNTQDIQTNLDLISASGGGTLFLQPGTYTLTSDISVPAGVTLQGVSRDGVIIDCNSSYKVQITGTNAYTTGTVAINDTQTTVTGTGTTFTVAMVGRYIYLNGLWYEITAFIDTTHVTIGNAYDGPNLSGYVYAIADVNFNPTIRKLTISGATGVGFKIIYASEPWIDDLIIVDNGTGLDIDYVVYPKLFVTSERNGVNMDMNYVAGFKVDYCSFSFSTTGAGVVMSNTIDATFFDTAVDENTGDGINMTSCSGIGIISVSVRANGGQGIEMVSGCDNNQLIAIVADGNTSDGIKLTATSDRNTIVASPITNNGGYGINIAAATCDNNVINSPVFSNNSSGNINNSGTLTVIIADDTAYSSNWNGDMGVPTKNTIWDASLEVDDNIKGYNALGSVLVAQTLGTSISTLSLSGNLTDRTAIYVAVYISRGQTITGVKFRQGTQGDYTADQNNYLALYSYSGGTMTQVAITANNGDVWKGTSNSIQTVAFSTPYVASPGIYFVGLLYNNSAQVTAPSIATTSNLGVVDFTNSAKLSSFVSAQDTLPSSQAMSGTTGSGNLFWVGLY